MKEIIIKHKSGLYQFNYVKTAFCKYLQETYTSVAVRNL